MTNLYIIKVRKCDYYPVYPKNTMTYQSYIYDLSSVLGELDIEYEIQVIRNKDEPTFKTVDDIKLEKWKLKGRGDTLEQQLEFVKQHNKIVKQKYRETHLEQMKEKDKIRDRVYRETHKEQILQRKQIYYETHKEQIAECRKKYKETHKEQIQEYNRQCHDCICGCSIRLDNKHKHEKTEKHRKYIDSVISS